MFKRNYKKYQIGSKYSKIISRQLNNLIVVLVILITILVVKMINYSTSNNIIEIIEKNIYHDFSWEQDGKRVAEYMKKFMGNTKRSIETFNIQIKE